MKTIDFTLSIMGFLFVALIGVDIARSESFLPEGILYTIFRTTETYPQEVSREIEAVQSEVDDIRRQSEVDLEQARREIAEQILRELEAERTGCISFAGMPNAICLGPRQTTE